MFRCKHDPPVNFVYFVVGLYDCKLRLIDVFLQVCVMILVFCAINYLHCLVKLHHRALFRSFQNIHKYHPHRGIYLGSFTL